jgi:hypothetical protein
MQSKFSRSRKWRVLQFVLLAASATCLLAPSHALAVIYQVDRSFPGGPNFVSLAGTVDVPLGSYTIMNKGPSPFTSVDLTLTVNGISYSVNYVFTDFISGSGEFLIDATATSLTFNTANANGQNPADLVFSANSSAVFATDRYSIGGDSGGSFEGVVTGAGNRSEGIGFPTEWGVAVVPEPSIVNFLAIPLAFLGFRVARACKQVE